MAIRFLTAAASVVPLALSTATRQLVASTLVAVAALLVLPNCSYAAEGVVQSELPLGASTAVTFSHSSVDALAGTSTLLGVVTDAREVPEFYGNTIRQEAPSAASITIVGLARYFEGVIGATLTGPLGQTLSGSRSIQ